MALGYGSEYQLLRSLGHHRKAFETKIKEIIKVGTDVSLEWLDYPSNTSRKSLDGEFVSIECFKNRLPKPYETVEKKWLNFWPSVRNAQNWDGVFKVEDVWYFVEAKAREKETKSICKAKGEGRKTIHRALEKTQKDFFGKEEIINWLGDKDNKSYQLANRLAFICFCKDNDIPAKLLYVSFINGFKSPRGDDSVKSPTKWDKIWREEYRSLGLTEKQLAGILYHVYVDCDTL